MFTVVDFENDGGVALVATKWLECHENELSTYWPPTKSSTLQITGVNFYADIYTAQVK